MSLRSWVSTSAQVPAPATAVNAEAPGRPRARGGRPSKGRPPGLRDPRHEPAASALAPRPGPRACAARPLPVRRCSGSRGGGSPAPEPPRAPARRLAPGAAALRLPVRRLPVRGASAPREAAPGRALAAASAPAARCPRRGAVASPAHARRRLPATVPAAPPRHAPPLRPPPRPGRWGGSRGWPAGKPRPARDTAPGRRRPIGCPRGRGWGRSRGLPPPAPLLQHLGETEAGEAEGPPRSPGGWAQRRDGTPRAAGDRPRALGRAEV